MELETEVMRGNQAKDLLEHPLMVEAFHLLRTQVMDQWASSPARDTEGREKLWQLTKLIDKLEGHLREVLETGKLAQIQVNDKKNLAQQAKELLGMS